LAADKLAEAFFQRERIGDMASSIDPESARLAHAAFARGDFENARVHASFFIERDPDDLEIRGLRAKSAMELALWPEALADIGQLIAARPHELPFRELLAACWLRIANTHRLSGQRDAAIAAYRNAAQSAPRQVDAYVYLGDLLLEAGKPHDALTWFAAAAPHRLDDAALMRKYAEVLLTARRDAEATELAARIAAKASDSWAWCWHFAVTMRAKGDLDASRVVLTALRDSQTNPALRMRAELGLALGLPAVYASTAQLHEVRAQFERNLATIVREYPAEKIRRIAPTPDLLCWDNFLLAYHGENDRPLQAQFGRWLAESLAALLPEFSRAPSPPARTRPKLAMVSNYFHECTVGSYFASWVETLARNWELILVHVGLDRDALTERLASYAHAEITLADTLAENASTLRALDADVILYPELGMDRDTIALAALRLAPLQVCAWGHPVTSGLPTVDAFVSCAAMEPDEAQQHYTERLITLPGLGTRYLSPDIPSEFSRQQMGLPEDRTLYLVPQTLYKLHPDSDSILVEIVRRDPSALFVLFELTPPSPVLRVHDRLMRALSNVSAEPRKHLHWFAQCSREDYLRINLACAVMIDGLHWSGGNTTLDALHCGLPVITCPGKYMRGRQSAAMLRAIDCDELIAQSPQELADIAVSVARDRQRRDDIVARIRRNLRSLTQSDAPLQALDRALRELLNDSGTATAPR
jgi:CRISPR-associated protein Csy1